MVAAEANISLSNPTSLGYPLLGPIKTSSHVTRLAGDSDAGVANVE